MTRDDWLTTFIHEMERVRPDIPRREAHRAGMTLYGDGNGDAAALATQFAEQWDGWIKSFVEELQRLRPAVSKNLATTIGVLRYAHDAHSDSRAAAQAYAESRPLQLRS
jgi:hypothetical protein